MTTKDKSYFEALMLDHAYGLLEADQLAELEAYLAGAEGESLRQRADAWKARLSQAASSGFPNVVFQAPAATPNAIPAKPNPAPGRKNRTTAWIFAGGIAAVFLAFAIPTIEWQQQRSQQSRQVALAKEKFDKDSSARQAFADEFINEKKSIEAKREAARKAVEEAQKEVTEAKQKLEKERRERQMVIKLSGPEKPMPGAPNEWKISTYDRNSMPIIPLLLTMVIRNQTDKELYSISVKEPESSSSTLHLPVSFWEKVKPQDDLILEITAKTRQETAAKLVEKFKLARPVYVTHLATDKPLYQPGEVVHFRSLTLERSTLIPPPEDENLTFKIVRPDGSNQFLSAGNGRVRNDSGMLSTNTGEPIRGIGCGEYTIPASALGGEYSLVVMKDNVPLQTRKFLVNRYTPDKFFKKLEFDGKSYGPGDIVQVRAEASRTEGGALANKPITVTATLDGKAIELNAPKTTDAKGVVNLKFALPQEIGAGQGALSIVFTDATGPETITRPIPVIGRKLEIEFFPEGGDLVAGVPNRVYFQVRTPIGKPADLKGYLTDGNGKIVDVQTLTDTEEAGVSRGQGSFVFTPKLNAKYLLKVERPIAIEEPKEGFALPAVKPDGVVLTALDEITAGDAPIRVQVQTPLQKRKLIVGAYGRGRLLDHQLIDVDANKPKTIELGKGVSLGGVVRVTVFEDLVAANGERNLIPLAERLVYRKAPQNLLLDIKPDKQRYFPGSKVGLELGTLDDAKKPLPAIMLVAVVNQSVITMADNKTDRLMPTHFLLAGEVRKPEDLEHADFLLGDHPKAAKALDNLLGVQGWRRFVEQKASAISREKPNAVDADARQLLVSTGQIDKPPVDLLIAARKKFEAEVEPKVEDAQSKLKKSDQDLSQFMSRLVNLEEYRNLRREEEAAQSAYRSAEEALQMSAGPDLKQSVSIAAGVLLLIATILLIRSLVRSMSGMEKSRENLVLGIVCLVPALMMIGLHFYQPTHAQKANGEARAEKLASRANPEMPAAQLPVDDLAMLIQSQTRATGVGAKPEEAKQNGFGFGGGGQGGGSARIEMKPQVAAIKGEGAPAPAGPIGGGPFGAARNHNPSPREADANKRGGMADKANEAFPWEMRFMNGLNERELDQAKKRMNDEKNDRRELAKKDGARRADGEEQLEQAEKSRRDIDGKRGALAKNPGTPLRTAFTWEEVNGKITDIQKTAYDSFYVREYVHQRLVDAANPELRGDFTETVYWHPVLVTNSQGKAKIEFDLADDVARYQVMVAAHTLDGRLAAKVATIEARKPFTVDPKLPIEVSHTDRIDIPVRVVNDSDDQREVKFAVLPQGLELLPSMLKHENDRWADSLSLAPNAKSRRVYSFKPSQVEGVASMRLEATSAGAPSDSILRKLTVVPDGFPVSGQVSGQLDKRATPTLALPSEIIPGTMRVRLNVYPSTLADLQAGLDGLLREPHGCFEQTSTTNYPNTLILDYLSTSDQAKPEVSRRAKDLLDRGYERLTSFECLKPANDGKQGYEWFGGTAPPHEALTAYGLLQFTDMARVRAVDPVMLKRTRDYLLAQRDGNGGFKRNPRALDHFGHAPDYITNAYILWALTESDPEKKHQSDITKEIATLTGEVKKHDDDTYFLSLVANTYFNIKKFDEGIEILKKIAAQQKKPDGNIPCNSTSITGSGGRDLEIETTSLAVMAFLKAKRPDLFTDNIQLAIRWIGQQRGGYGGFGSTQATILALKAVIAYTKDQKQMPEGGTLSIFVGDKKVAEKVFSAADREVITLEVLEPEKIFGKDRNKDVRIELDSKQSLPYTLMWECRTLKPLSSDACALELKTSLSSVAVQEGDTVTLNASIKNKLDKGHGMAVAIIGIPAGAKVPTDLKQLTKLREEGKIAYFEIQGRELVLYWRELAPKQEIDLKIELICEIPGQYRGPASRAYLYYNADAKAWNDPLGIAIKPMD